MNAKPGSNLKLSVVSRTFLTILLILLLTVDLNLVSPAYAATAVTINWTDVRQTIDGFGASGAFQRATYLMNMSEPASTTINSSGWTLLTGTKTITWSGTLSAVLFYVETAAGTDNFYIDDASLH